MVNNALAFNEESTGFFMLAHIMLAELEEAQRQLAITAPMLIAGLLAPAK